jgi:acyl-CoA hydrolase
VLLSQFLLSSIPEPADSWILYRAPGVPGGGKSFLALYSTYTDKDGNLRSKIVPTLTNGIFTTVSRTEVQYVVTEYGVANLKGQNLRTRVKELVSIAHPDFRDWLLFEARKMNFIP